MVETEKITFHEKLYQLQFYTIEIFARVLIFLYAKKHTMLMAVPQTNRPTLHRDIIEVYDTYCIMKMFRF